MIHLPAEMLIAAAPLAGLAGDVLLHVTISHIAPGIGFLLRAALGLGAGAVVTAALSAVALGTHPVSVLDAAMLWLVAMLTFLALGFGYFNFVNLNVTSLRVRLLRELLEHYPNGLTREEIVQRYGAGTVLRLRLQRLVGSGHAIRRGDSYYLARRHVLLIAHVFTFLRRIVIPNTVESEATPNKV